MTGNLGSKGLTEYGRISPEPTSKVYDEAARVQRKVEKEQKRTRRKVGLTSGPKYDPFAPATPETPGPLPTYEEIGQLKKRKPKGRKANILAGRMMKQRQILNTQQYGKSILS